MNLKKSLLSFSIAMAASQLANASTLSLSSTPLAVAGAVDPNIVFLLDNSGSMDTIVPNSPYDADATLPFNCDDNKEHKITSTSTLYVQVNSDGDPYIWIGWKGDEYDFGTAQGGNNHTGLTGKDLACFDNDRTYRMALDANKTNRVGQYSGHFLNWYFGDQTPVATNEYHAQSFGTGNTRKPGSLTRMDVAKSAGVDIVNGLSNARIALANYHRDRQGTDTDDDDVWGPILLSAMADADTTHKNTITTAINAMTANGWTPLAQSFRGLGRYFIEGKTGNTLTLDPNGAATTADDTAIFDLEPFYQDNAFKPTNSNPVMQFSCQKNFIISLTDGQPTQDRAINSYLKDYDNDCPDGNSICSKHSGEADFYDHKTANTYETNASDFLDDVATALYDIDLRPDLDTSDGSDIKNNIVSYVIGFADERVQNDQLMIDTTSQSGGEFLIADTGASLQAVFNDVLATIYSQIGSVSSVAFNSSQLNSDSAVYQGKFNTSRWAGDLEAISLSDSGAIEGAVWSAGDKLNNKGVSTRNVITFNPTSKAGVTFAWANLDATQKADLYTVVDLDDDGNTTNDDDDAQLLVSYLKGDRTSEGSSGKSLRIRTNVLGDIVNSTPVFVGAPELGWPDYDATATINFGAANDGYPAWKATTVKDRDQMIYVGANDGMLHGFNAALTGTDAGQEMFAYIPGAIYSNGNNAGLHYLAEQDYQHQFYVDATPAVSDIYMTHNSSTAWHTVLIGGLRAGGRGIYALDITDPSRFSSPNTYADLISLWEFTSDNDPNLGYTYDTPSIVKTANDEWAAIFSNGYNNTGDGHAELFIVFIEKGLDGTWSTGDYLRLDTETGSTVTPNGLSASRVVDLDGDKVADRVYAGDIQGNMWVFDISDANTANWGVAHETSGVKKPLFTAKDHLNNIQPITTAPLLARHPETTSVYNQPNLLVMFGTGKYLEAVDVSSNMSIQSYYSVWDDDSAGGKTLATLQRREIVTSGSLRTITGTAIDWAADDGWYMEFENQGSGSVPPATGLLEGERIASDSLLRRKVLFFNTIIPSGTACEAGGTGWQMALDYATGRATVDASFDANNDGKIDGTDYGYVGSLFTHGLPAKPGILSDKQYTPGSDGTIEDRDIYVGAGSKEGKLSWQEAIRN